MLTVFLIILAALALTFLLICVFALIGMMRLNSYMHDIMGDNDYYT